MALTISRGRWVGQNNTWNIGFCKICGFLRFPARICGCLQRSATPKPFDFQSQLKTSKNERRTAKNIPEGPVRHLLPSRRGHSRTIWGTIFCPQIANSQGLNHFKGQFEGQFKGQFQRGWDRDKNCLGTMGRLSLAQDIEMAHTALRDGLKKDLKTTWNVSENVWAPLLMLRFSLCRTPKTLAQRGELRTNMQGDPWK